MDNFKPKLMYTPYSLKETLGWLWRSAVGPNRKNPGNVQYIPNKICLNEIDPQLELVFIGDVMDSDNKNLEFTPTVMNFIQNIDYLIGNFEATLTNERKNFFMDQRHTEKIISGLKHLFSPQKTYLSIANNHAGDFEKEIFQDSIQTLQSAGFNIFGFSEQPYFDLLDKVRIITGTMWSNKLRGFEYISDFDEIEQNFDSNKMNILYPHWGYEMELFPRLVAIDQAQSLLEDFDAIIGHHSHTPQPICIEEDSRRNLNKLIAYSTGDFCIGKPLKWYYFGEIIKIKVGPLKSLQNVWGIGEVEWKFTQTIQKDKNTILVDLQEKIPL